MLVPLPPSHQFGIIVYVKCPSFLTQFLEHFKCANSTLHFCTRNVDTLHIYAQYLVQMYA